MALSELAETKIYENKLEPILLTQVRSTDMVTLVHDRGNIATKRVQDFLPEIGFWFASGWHGPYRMPNNTPRH